MAFACACSDFPGMAPCPGRFPSEAQDDLWKHIELHATLAHGEDSDAWADEDRATVSLHTGSDRA